jgi:hypothetical protein
MDKKISITTAELNTLIKFAPLIANENWNLIAAVKPAWQNEAEEGHKMGLSIIELVKSVRKATGYSLSISKGLIDTYRKEGVWDIQAAHELALERKSVLLREKYAQIEHLYEENTALREELALLRHASQSNSEDASSATS